jgi:phage tail-like protein
MPFNASTRKDPYGRFNFLLEIDGVTKAGFSEVSGLATETEVVEYREGSDPPNTVRKLPGLTKYSNIVLKRGVTADTSLWSWYKNVINGINDSRNGSIILRDKQGAEILRWNFQNGWPCKWEGPVLKATSSEVAIESIEIAHEGLDLEIA